MTQRELLAVVSFTRQFRHYLLGTKFRLWTDHGSLAWLFRFKALRGQLARWLELSQYDLVIEHRAGKQHGNADAMSRLDISGPNNCDFYVAGSSPSILPRGGCDYCSKRHQEWTRFEDEVDYVAPLAVHVDIEGR